MAFRNGPAILQMPSPYRYGPVNSGAARAIPVWTEFRNGPEHIYALAQRIRSGVTQHRGIKKRENN